MQIDPEIIPELLREIDTDIREVLEQQGVLHRRMERLQERRNAWIRRLAENSVRIATQSA